ncbi:MULTISPECIES: hypothetical protein [Microbacterium]|uniref:hypothetical protein n=1 Tax=Microbacterium TaxID=33882 RepID=UPI001F9F44A4|nr:hypothetical protein [Actinomycetota bacterium]
MSQSRESTGVLLLALAVVAALLAWAAQLTIGWFLPAVFAAVAVLLAVTGLASARRRRDQDPT